MQGLSPAAIGRQLGRHSSSIARELKRNRCNDGAYRTSKAISRTQRRRSWSRRSRHCSDDYLHIVNALVRLDWSPEQVSGWLHRHRVFSISHQTLYRYIWYDRIYGGTLYKHLRQAGKRRRKRYGSYDSRGVMGGKRHITERPVSAEKRSWIGHWQGDTVIGAGDQHCIVTLVERKTKYTLIGKLKARNTAELNRRVTQLVEREVRRVRTITADNGTEFHQFQDIEDATGALFNFCTPYHSWERGLNENTNGLIRQYLPKGKSMAKLTQRACDKIAKKLDTRPRKTLGFKTPEECYAAP